METKKCPKCKQVKSVINFYSKNRNSYHSWCKPCLYDSQKERWKNRKYEAVKLMGGECIDCGYKKNYAALEFHHLKPIDKDFDWSRLREMKWSSIIEELKKCVLICSNCHRERHNPDSTIDLINPKIVNVTLQNRELCPTGKCPICEISVYGTKFCSTLCASHAKRKVERPCKEELEKLLKITSFVKIGKMFGVSDNAVRKWVKQYNLPIK